MKGDTGGGKGVGRCPGSRPPDTSPRLSTRLPAARECSHPHRRQGAGAAPLTDALSSHGRRVVDDELRLAFGTDHRRGALSIASDLGCPGGRAAWGLQREQAPARSEAEVAGRWRAPSDGPCTGRSVPTAPATSRDAPWTLFSGYGGPQLAPQAPCRRGRERAAFPAQPACWAREREGRCRKERGQRAAWVCAACRTGALHLSCSARADDHLVSGAGCTVFSMRLAQIGGSGELCRRSKQPPFWGR